MVRKCDDNFRYSRDNAPCTYKFCWEVTVMARIPIDGDQISDMLHTLAECEAALSDDAHETHRGRLARIRWLLMGLGVGQTAGVGI